MAFSGNYLTKPFLLFMIILKKNLLELISVIDWKMNIK